MSDSDEETPQNSPIPSSPKSPPQSPEPPPIRIFSDNYEVIFTQLVCLGCERFLKFPLHFCSSGHTLCSSCVPLLKTCMTCFAPITGTRNFLLEEIMCWTGFQCEFAFTGCRVMAPLHDMPRHKRTCMFAPMACPLRVFDDVSCGWLGLKREFHVHAREHIHIVYPVPPPLIFNDSFGCCMSTTHYCFLLLREEILWYCRRFYKGNWTIVVLQMGITEVKYRCVFAVNSRNGLDNIRISVPVEVAGNSLEDLFKTGKCFKLPDIMMKNFVVNNSFNIKTYIYEVINSN